MRLGLLGATGLMAALLTWQLTRSHAPAPKTASVLRSASQPASGRAESPRSPASGASLAADADSPFLGPESPEQAAQAKARETTNAPSTSISSTSQPVSAAKSPVKAPPETASTVPKGIRLQGIVFDPIRPSAMINGKTLFVGEMFGEFRLVAVDRGSATLVAGGQTNLLTLR
jgi:hypothetical protein